MSHIGPQSGIGHAHIMHTALKALACGVCSGAIVTVAAEHTVIQHIARSKDVKSVAPRRMRDAVHIMESDAIAAANRSGA